MPYATLLAEPEIESALERIPNWHREGDMIVRDLRFVTFPTAIEFVDEIARLAEEADHHPDIDIRWRRVRLLLTTKASRGLTAKDFALATRIDEVAHRLGAEQ